MKEGRCERRKDRMQDMHAGQNDRCRVFALWGGGGGGAASQLPHASPQPPATLSAKQAQKQSFRGRTTLMFETQDR